MNNPAINLESMRPRGSRTAREYLQNQSRKRLMRAYMTTTLLALSVGLLTGILGMVLVTDSLPKKFSKPYKITFDGPVSTHDIDTCQRDDNCMDIETTFREQ